VSRKQASHAIFRPCSIDSDTSNYKRQGANVDIKTMAKDRTSRGFAAFNTAETVFSSGSSGHVPLQEQKSVTAA
jgi:hypothetical protein